jgi:hypothetical protein
LLERSAPHGKADLDSKETNVSEVPNAKILQTTVIPGERNAVVQLLISDGSPEGPSDTMSSGTIHLHMTVRIELDGMPPLAAIEYEAVDLADSVLQALMREKAEDMKAARYYHQKTQG